MSNLDLSEKRKVYIIGKVYKGRIRVSDDSYTFDYYLKDHLGNTRVVISDDGTVQQASNYYPFGMRWNNANTINNQTTDYLYNGKEIQEELGWYDYGWRMYDAALGRWNVVDPLAEWDFKTSPYVYVANNPLMYIDPDGQDKNDRIRRRAKRQKRRIERKNPNAEVKINEWVGQDSKVRVSVDQQTSNGVSANVYTGKAVKSKKDRGRSVSGRGGYMVYDNMLAQSDNKDFTTHNVRMIPMPTILSSAGKSITNPFQVILPIIFAFINSDNKEQSQAPEILSDKKIKESTGDNTNSIGKKPTRVSRDEYITHSKNYVRHVNVVEEFSNDSVVHKIVPFGQTDTFYVRRK